MEDFFTGDVVFDDVIPNQEEVSGWTRLPDHLSGEDPVQRHLARSVYAAYRQRRGGPLFGNWLRAIRYEALPRWSLTGEPPLVPKKPLRMQLGVVEVADLESVWMELRGVGEYEYIEERALFVWRYDRGVFVMARPVAGSLIVVAYEPAFAGAPSSANRRIFPMIRRRLAAVNGKLVRFDAEGSGPLSRVTP